VMLDVPGGTYWKSFDRYLKDELLAHGYVNESDLCLFRYTDSISAAVEEIEGFYRVYHSQRYVNERLVLRLTMMPNREQLEKLSAEFDDILEGPIVPTEASGGEIRDEDVVDLPRIALNFDRMHAGRLRLLVDALNQLAPPAQAS
jgi:hypothetical protein